MSDRVCQDLRRDPGEGPSALGRRLRLVGLLWLRTQDGQGNRRLRLRLRAADRSRLQAVSRSHQSRETHCGKGDCGVDCRLDDLDCTPKLETVRESTLFIVESVDGQTIV